MFSYEDYMSMVDFGIQNDNQIFLRHDVDISLDKALKLAEIESKKNYHATYFILLTSPFYNALTHENLQKIRMIKELGHWVGLHYDLSIKDMSNMEYCMDIMMQLGLLIQYTNIGTEGTAVTFHKPVMGKDADIELVNLLNKEEIYCPNYDMRYKYISDSAQNWREDPYQVMSSEKYVHINTHPIWYNDKSMTREECLLNMRHDLGADKLVLKEIRDINEYLIRINDV